MSATFKVDTAELDRILRDLDKNTGEALASVAFDVQGEIVVVATQMDIYDTGAFIGGITATEKTPGKMWWVHDQVLYGIWQELGHHNVPARPSFSTSVENVSKRLAKHYKDITK